MKNLLRTLKQKWLFFAQKVGQVNTAILLSIVYFFVIGIMALVAKLLRKDLLNKKMKPTQTSYWLDRDSGEQTLERHKYQF
jgi:hypothetical protein